MSWRVTVEYVTADGTTHTKIWQFPTKPDTQHWADRRGFIHAPGFFWHVCGINHMTVQRVDAEERQ